MKVCIKKRTMLFALLIFPLLEPGIFKENGYGNIDLIYTGMKLFSDFCMVIIVVGRKKLSPFCISILGYESILLFSTIINGNGWNDFRKFIGPALAAIGICILFDIFNNYMECIRLIRNILFVYIIINMISVEMVLAGSYTSIGKFEGGYFRYFLGADNRFVFYFMPAILCAFMMAKYCEDMKNWILFWFILIQSLAVLWVCWSIGAMLVIIVLMLYFLIFKNWIRGTIGNIYTYIIGFLCINLLFWFGLGYFGEDLVLLAGKLFSKSGTLNIRFLMWDRVIKTVQEYPILGIGTRDMESLNGLLYNYSHAHNLFMNTILRGGILGIISFFIILFIGTEPIWKLKNSVIGKTIAIIILACLILSLADSYDDVYFYMILAISYNITKLQCGNIDINKDKELCM